MPLSKETLEQIPHVDRDWIDLVPFLDTAQEIASVDVMWVGANVLFYLAYSIEDRSELETAVSIHVNDTYCEDDGDRPVLQRHRHETPEAVAKDLYVMQQEMNQYIEENLMLVTTYTDEPFTEDDILNNVREVGSYYGS